MTPERWKLVCALFHDAVERSPSEADSYLSEQCAGDGELLSEVRRMLEEHARTDTLGPNPWDAAPASPATPPVFSPGQVVAGRYRIVRYISRGGMGEVYEAEHRLLPDRVALKTLLPAIASDEAMIARFKQEIQLARKIAHPNVCKLFDLEWHQQDASTVYFLTMELLHGETLSAHLQRHGRMSAMEALPLIEQMAEALHAAHRSGVIHRDFTPRNVMLVPSPEGVRAVVTDFGLARRVSTESGTTETITNRVAGTLEYMAPELFTGSQASFRSDIYALGVVAYEMVAGALPFAGETPMAAAFLRTHKPIPSPSTLAPDLDSRLGNAILRAIDPDPGRRFAEVREFPKALRGEPVSVTVALPSLTRRKALAAGCAVAALAAGAFGWRTWRHHRNQLSPEAARLYQQGVDDIHAGAYFAATNALDQAVRLAPGFGPARARLAESWLELDLPEKAAREFLPIRRLDNSSLPRIDQLLIEAVDRTITREYDGAVAKYEQMRQMAGGGAGDLDIDLGRAYENAHKDDSAMTAYRRAAEGPRHSPAAWLRLAVLYGRRNKMAESNAAFAEADRGYRQSSNLEGITELTLQQGIAANRLGKYSEAAVLLHKAIDHAHDTGNLQQEISAKLYLANASYAAGDAGLAQSLAREALDTAEAHQMEELTIRGLYNLGAASASTGDYKTAEQYFQNALGLALRAGSSHRAAVCQLNLASLYDRLHRSAEQVREAKEALAYFQPNHWFKETFQGLELIGRGEQYQDHFEAALSSLQLLLDNAGKAGDRTFMAAAHEDLGDLLSVQENYPKALSHYQEFLNLNTDEQRAGYAILDYAITLAMLGRFPEALPWFIKAEEAAAKHPVLLPDLIQCRAEMSLSRNEYRNVIESTTTAGAKIAGLAPRTEVGLLRLLGLALLRSGDRQAGLKKCQEAFAAAQRLDDPGELLDTRLALLEALVATRDSVGATGVFHEMEQALASHPETRWRAFALLARSSRQYADRAKEAFGQLETLWGLDALHSYLKRPDVQQLVAPFAGEFRK